MNTNTVLILAIVGAAVIGLLAWETYQAQQNSLGGLLGKGIASLI